MNTKTLLGPLYKLYSDSNVFEIVIDSSDEVYYAHKDGIKNANKIFKDGAALDQMVERLLKFSKKASFFILDEHTRVNIVLPPFAIKGPSLVISKFPKSHLTLDDLVKFKALNFEGKKVIEDIMKEGNGFIAAGNMGSGKTTLMNILISLVPLPNRVVTLERYPDFIVTREKVCRLTAPNQKSSEMIELIGMAERMRADFVVLSDTTGPVVMPFIDLVQTYSTGCVLVKGENVLDALKMLETKALISSEGLSLEDVRYVIAQAFKHIIFQERRADGSRVISNISSIIYASGELKLVTKYKA